MKSTLRNLFILSFVAVILFSCKGNKNSAEYSVANDSALMAADTLPYNKKADFKLSFTIANLPSPLEVINTIYSTKVPFDNALLNSTDNAEKYLNAYKRAVNYGIYGVDMAYISYYGNKQDLYDYYSTSKKLAGSLGMEKTFEKFTDRFKENSDNKDSVMAIVDMVYSETDKYLRTNDRLVIASYIIAGAFMESLHISSALMKTQEKNTTYNTTLNKIYEQKLVLNNLVDLFKEFKDKESVALETDLHGIKKVFDELKDPSQMNKENLQKISAATSLARNNAVK